MAAGSMTFPPRINMQMTQLICKSFYWYSYVLDLYENDVIIIRMAFIDKQLI